MYGTNLILYNTLIIYLYSTCEPQNILQLYGHY